MFIFGLCSTSDDQPSDSHDESHLKCKTKCAPNYQKMKCSFLDYDPSDESCPKCENMANKSSKNEMQFTHPPNEMGMGQEQYENGSGMGQVWDRNGLGMGQVWDGTIWVDFMQMAYYPADSCAISPLAFLLFIGPDT